MPKSVLDYASAGPALDTSTVQKSGGGFGYGEGYQVPKSWFNDPFALMDTMGLGYKANPSTLSYGVLQAMAEKNVVISSIIQTRVNQVATFCQPQRNKYGVGYRIMHKDRRRKLTYSEKEHILDLEKFVHRMGVDKNPERDTLETFVKKVVRDRLQYDQICAEKVLRRNGKPHSVFAVPADTIRIATPKSRKGTPLSPYEAENATKYVQVIDGNIVNEYARRDLIFRVANPRTDIKIQGYGFSELEMLIQTITSHLWAEEWNRKVFSQGSTVKGILNVTGNIPQQQMEAFRRQWLMQVSGVSNSWRTPILNSENLQWIPLQPSNNDMGYQQWLEYLIKVACAVFLIDPSEINFDTRAGVGNQPMFMTTNEAQQKVSKDRGLQPLVRHVQTLLNDDVISEIDDDYELMFLGLDAKTEEQSVQLRIQEVGSYKTLNEIRREADDLPPVEGGDMVMNPVFTGYMVQQQAQQAQQAQMAGGGAPGMPGAPPGGDGGAAGGDQQEMFANLFGKKGEGQEFSTEEQGLQQHVDRDASNAMLKRGFKGKPVEKPQKDEETSEEETSDDWEETIHASERGRVHRVSRLLTNNLSKALHAFEELE